MPDLPIIDTHLHVWDQTRLRHSAFDGHPLFGHPYHVEDYQQACGDLQVESMVLLECYADFWDGGGQYLKEIAFVEDEQKRDPRIKAIIPMVPLEWGEKVRPVLEEMREHPGVRGIRRIMEFDANPRGLTMSEGFIAGTNLLSELGWSFDINPNHTQMDSIREWVKLIHGVPMILDHCGKPGIRQGRIEQFREDMFDLARHPNMWVKLDALGPDRTIFAGDYPILLQSTTMTQWVDVLDHAFADLGVSETETRKICRDNANAFYRLGL